MIVGLVGGVFGLIAIAVAVVVVVVGVIVVRNNSNTASPSPLTTPAVAQPGTPAAEQTPTPSIHTPSYPTRTPMSPAEIDRVFRTYMDGSPATTWTFFKSGTCPRLRSTLLGFALNGYYIGKWTLLPYEVPADADRIIVKAKMTQLKPSTGDPAGEVTYSWYVERDAGGSYWVCGWLGEK
ncbi:hypothetical protein ACGF5C_27740 [Micromonospora sp. NPDC047620]|uniref:hypothetical protein n=1 Tax=Micromonospora sp. NPDC047620 TaxID=3364251 RepID=UPI00371883B1